MTLELTLTGAQVLRPDGWDDGPIGLCEGKISDPCGRNIDLSDHIVLPGIVDIHGDGFERHMAPRRGALRAADDGVVAAEAELAANGITTAVLAQFYSWEGGMRGPEFARHMCESLARAAPGLATDLRLQLRLETSMAHEPEDALDLVDRFAIPYVVFNDHLPADRLAQGRTPRRLTGQALKSGRSPEAHLRIMQDLFERRDALPRALDALSESLSERRVLMGSHDDPDEATRADWRARGATISEFPLTTEAAKAAISNSDAVICGAPNVVRGGSHEGNVSALDLIEAGLVTALASDYHYPAPRQAVLRAVEMGLVDLAQGWSLISRNPARLLGLTDRGTLAQGSRADLVILDAGTMRVAATIAGGQFTYLSGPVGHRFCG